jgi:hypothetical protein
MTGPTDRRGRSIERRGAAVVATVLLVGLAIVAGVLTTGGRGGPSASPSSAPAVTGAIPSPVPVATGTSPTAAPAASAGPTVPPDSAWDAVQVAPFAAVADLRADRADAAGVQLDTTFTLTSESDAFAAALATRLETDPPIGVVVPAASASRAVRLRPAAHLTPGQVYRFTLRGEDGTVAGSWAFQARASLHVVSVLPGDQTTAVPVGTGIEVTFDQDAAADMGPFFTISPAVGGRFERHARPPPHAGSSTRSSERLEAGNGAARAQVALS